MDKWIVAVAAGAGYIAQHFNKFKPESSQTISNSSIEGSFNGKPESPKQPPDRKWAFRKLSRKSSSKKDGSQVKNSQFDGEKVLISGNYDCSSDGESVGELQNKLLTPRSKMIIRKRRKNGVTVRPLSSLESCLMAQLHTEHVELKHPMQPVRPFFVTDGSNVINRSNVDSFVVENNLQTYSQNNKTGSTDATLLVCLGMSFGILYSFMANKREVEKLNRLLKQKENLVQDLEEELEMKDSLTVQELTIDDDNKSENVIVTVKDDSFGEIEAELEAELEMLELNMSSSKLERKISNLVEVDPEFEPDYAEGELRADMLHKQANTDKDEIGSTGTTHSANYAVSPTELRLRLHEVLQSQLEERIRELEAEIKNQNQNKKCWDDYLSSDAGDEKYGDEAVVLNLSGEALDAYNEACNEFAEFDDEEDDDVYSGTGGDDDVEFDEDEMEKILIKHIVEKARQGSPVVLNAQRALFSE